MQYRALGKTGIKVSPYCLGAMMLAQWATPTTTNSIRITDSGCRNQLYRHGRCGA